LNIEVSQGSATTHYYTSIEGLPVSSLNCDRPLDSWIRTLWVVMSVGC